MTVTIHRSPFTMKLLFYSPRFYPLVGGLEKVVAAWGNELVKMGVEVVLITNTPNSEPERFGFKVYRRPSFRETVRLMRAADMVVQFNVALKGLPVWLLSGKPLVFSHHTLLYEPGTRAPINQWLKRWVSDHLARQNICCSQYIARQFKKAVVVHSPYDAAVFKNEYLERRKNSLVFAGRLVRDKGVDILLKAVSLLDPSSFTGLVIAGDGELRQELEKLSVHLGLKERVTFTGSMSSAELVSLLNKSTIMVVPSVVEPFGITVLEGLASGCRMIVSDTGGLPEAAGGFARLFKNSDPEGLAAALTTTLKEDNIEPAWQDKQAHLSALTIEATATQFLEEIERIGIRRVAINANESKGH